MTTSSEIVSRKSFDKIWVANSVLNLKISVLENKIEMVKDHLKKSCSCSSLVGAPTCVHCDMLYKLEEPTK